MERTEARYTGDDIEHASIHGFIQEELAYLDANLYFKHNVQKEVIDINGSHSLSTLPKDSLAALGWFLQCLVEELERQKVSGLTIKILSHNSKKNTFLRSGWCAVRRFYQATEEHLAIRRHPEIE